MKNLNLEEKMLIVFLLCLGLLGILIYIYPTQFFAIYDKILFFMIQ